MATQRYLFLDIDGVLNSERTIAAFGKLSNPGRVKANMLKGLPLDTTWDPISVNLLRTAHEALDFKIIISSAWRKSLSLRDFHVIFDDFQWDTRGIIIGKTGDGSGPRGRQIKEWLQENNAEHNRYCILDDDSDMLEEQMESFVKTSYKEGLNFEAFCKIFSVFGKNYDSDDVKVLRRMKNDLVQS